MYHMISVAMTISPIGNRDSLWGSLLGLQKLRLSNKEKSFEDLKGRCPRRRRFLLPRVLRLLCSINKVQAIS